MIDYSRLTDLNALNPPKPKTAEKLSKSAYSFLQKGDALFVSSHFKEAKETYEKCLEAYQKIQDTQGAGLCLSRLGRTLEILGLYREARQTYKESLRISQASGNTQGIARCQAHLGNVGWATGDYKEAGNYLREAFSGFLGGMDAAGQALVHDLTGNLKLSMGEDAQAESHYLSAYSLAKKLGDNFQLEAWNHFHLGALALFRKRYDEAQERFTKALQYFVQLKDDLGQAAALIHLGEIACSRKNLSAARPHLQKAVQILLPTHCQPLLTDALTGVSQLLKAMKEEKKALTLLMVALSHPTCRQQTKDRMVDLVISLESSYTRPEVEKGFKWATTVSLEEMAAGWLSASTQQDKPKKI